MQRVLACALLIAVAHAASAQSSMAQLRERWNVSQVPFKVHGDTYYVGTRGLSAILITSPQGHVLIDAALPESAEPIAANIRKLGFKVEDIKLILNTHVHFDHAGGIAKMQKMSGAAVKASESSAKVLASGEVGKDDPQFGTIPPIAPVSNVQSFENGEVQRVGKLALTPHLTPGHTPGGTTWTWRSCEGQRCVNIVYADSLNPLSAPGYLYSGHAHTPNGEAQLAGSFAVLEKISCDILLTPHPELADLFGKLAKKSTDETMNPFVNAVACRAYVDAHKAKLSQRLKEEQPKDKK